MNKLSQFKISQEDFNIYVEFIIQKFKKEDKFLFLSQEEFINCCLESLISHIKMKEIEKLYSFYSKEFSEAQSINFIANEKLKNCFLSNQFLAWKSFNSSIHKI